MSGIPVRRALLHCVFVRQCALAITAGERVARGRCVLADVLPAAHCVAVSGMRVCFSAPPGRARHAEAVEPVRRLRPVSRRPRRRAARGRTDSQTTGRTARGVRADARTRPGGSGDPVQERVAAGGILRRAQRRPGAMAHHPAGGERQAALRGAVRRARLATTLERTGHGQRTHGQRRRHADARAQRQGHPTGRRRRRTAGSRVPRGQRRQRRLDPDPAGRWQQHGAAWLRADGGRSAHATGVLSQRPRATAARPAYRPDRPARRHRCARRRVAGA
ncbi:hypothetical protein NB705_001764 [Xanthomonas sacchari]|nr:hypothetical protein [Xanthomonas sacchari]